MKFTRLALGVLLSAFLLGGAVSSAQTNISEGAPNSRTFLVLGNNSPVEGAISIYRLANGIPQDLNSPFLYFIAGEPEGMSVDASTQRLYVTAAISGKKGNIGGILGYKYSGANGFTLTELPGSPNRPASYSFGLGLVGDYAGGFLYASNEFLANIVGFQIDSSGKLGQPLPGSPYPAGFEPFYGTFDAQDGFLYWGNNGTISGYQVNAATGALTALPGSPYASGTYIGPVAVDSVHHLLYASSAYDMTIWVYTITATGALVPTASSPVYTGEILAEAALSPSGNLLYVGSSSSNNVLGYRVNTKTGSLSPLPGSPFPVGSNPGPVIIDPTGAYLYVANDGDGTVSGFHVPPSGELTPLTGSPFSLTVGEPTAMVTVTLP